MEEAQLNDQIISHQSLQPSCGEMQQETITDLRISVKTSETNWLSDILIFSLTTKRFSVTIKLQTRIRKVLGSKLDRASDNMTELFRDFTYSVKKMLR
jgi:hypothetical protein